MYNEAATDRTHDVLMALVGHDGRKTIALDFAETSDLVPASGRDVDNVLLDAHDRRYIVGERREGNGAVARWFKLNLTVLGLRRLGEWPPAGREWQPGSWDDGYWGTRARPLLHRLRDNPPPSSYYLRDGLGSEDPEPSLEWAALLQLLEGGLVAGHANQEGVDLLRVTDEGHQALDPTPRDPLDIAEAQLRSGTRVDAIIKAVECGLGSRLQAMATKLGVETTKADGHPLGLARVNDGLYKAGAYPESDRTQVEAWVKLRNDLAHGKDGQISDDRVAICIAGIRVFLNENLA